MTIRGILAILALASLAALGGCANMTEIRVENASTLDYTGVTVAGVPFDDVAAGATSGYRQVDLRFGLGVIELTVDGRRLTGKTLSFDGRRYTHRVDVVDLEAGHLSIDVIPEHEPSS